MDLATLPEKISRIRVDTPAGQAGVLSFENGSYAFAYQPGGEEASLTMPQRTASFNSGSIHPIFQMNIPEGYVRHALYERLQRYTKVNDLLGREAAKRVPQLALGMLLIVILAAVTWVQSGYWTSAEAMWGHVLAVTKDNYRAHTLYGKALWADGRRAEALVHYKKVAREAVLIGPAHAEIQSLLGNALVDLGRTEEAVPYFEESLRVMPDHQPTHNELGNALAAMGRFDEAIAHYQRALELRPEDPSAHNGLGSALDDLGRVDEAIAQYYKALEFDPKYAAAHSNLAAAFARQGRIEEAAGEMRTALEHDSNNSNFHYNYALLINQQGDVAEAIDHLEQALELDPQNQGARQTLEKLRGNP
jgi:Flp pilus assembly protein TadD